MRGIARHVSIVFLSRAELERAVVEAKAWETRKNFAACRVDLVFVREL